MANTPQVGKTATLAKGATAIAFIQSITIEIGSREVVEVDCIDTALATAATRLPATLHAPVINIEGAWANPASHIALATDLADGSSDAYTLTLPSDLGSWTGNAHVTALSITNANAEAVNFRATLTAAGAWTKST